MNRCTNYRFLILLLFVVFMGSLGTQPAYAGEEAAEKKQKGSFIGVYPTDLTKDHREALNYKGKDGVMLDGIVEGGPAEAAGLEAGDILIAIDKDKIGSMEDLRKALKSHKPGDKVKVTVVRDGKEKSNKLTLGEKPDRDTISKTYEYYSQMKSKKVGFLGVETMTLEDELADYFEVKHGVMIKRVVEDSPAEKAKMQAGDIIVEIADEKIKTNEDVFDVVRSHKPDETVEVKFVRRGRAKSVKATLSGTTDHSVRMPSLRAIPGLSERIMLYDSEDFEDITDKVKEALEDLNLDELDFHEESEDLKLEMMELKKEMELLKEEMKKVKEMREKNEHK